MQDAAETYQVIRSLAVDATIREILLQRERPSGRRGMERLLDALEGAFQTLGAFPFFGRAADDRTLRERGYRKLRVAELIVVYRVEEDTRRVFITIIFYQRENLEGLV